eukprot:COSAG01_NODE_9131_length_2543_cov_2.161211_1_plen_65_part_10
MPSSEDKRVEDGICSALSLTDAAQISRYRARLPNEHCLWYALCQHRPGAGGGRADLREGEFVLVL